MKISGIEIPDFIIINNKKLYLNGAAMRTKFFVNTYIIALYSEKPITDEKEAIHGNTARNLRMLLTTPLATPTLVSQNIESGVKESLGKKYIELKHIVDNIKTTIEQSNVGYKDYIDNFFDSDKKMYYYKNGDSLGEIGENNNDGQTFGEALFDMYVGKNPKDQKIKKALLKGF